MNEYYDTAGNLLCGQDFMAGTVCSLAPGHSGPHAPICQTCGVDWIANNGCECIARCMCEAPIYDADEGYVFCEECRCWGELEVAACFLIDSHDGPHQHNPMPVTDEEIASAIASIQNDMPALVVVFKTCVDCGQSIGCTMGGDPPTCKTHN